MNKKIEIPIYYYWKDGIKYYDYDSMGDEYADKLREITDENVEVIIKSNDKQTWEVR